MIKLRQFVSPNNAADTDPSELTLESVKAAFGIKEEPPAAAGTVPDTDPPAANPPDGGQANPPNQDPDNGNPPQEPPAEPPANEPPAQTPPAGDKAGQAFAQQRVQIREYQKTFNGIAKVLGITDTSDPNVVMEKLNDVIVKAEAKNSGVPEEMLRRLQMLEQKDQQSTMLQIQQQAYYGFQQVKDQFKLDDKGLQQFADELVQSGNNPFETPIDLVREYQFRHFNDLLAAAREEGARQEQERAAKAANHGSTPNSKQGQGGADPEKITTVAQLTAWFNKQEGK